MFQSRFGPNTPAFQLSPDPTFYFDSRSRRDTHHRFNEALDAGSSVLVLSGDIGAGKTMLLRGAFARTAAPDTLIANVVSSQLDACELLQVALIGFGCSPSDTSAAGLRLAFGKFLTSVRDADRRALLAIDEAQNLAEDAFVLLGELIKEARNGRAPLQVCLAGQLELVPLMRSPHAEGLRRGAIVFCHLGPLDAEETGDYIQHRLMTAGWVGQATFADGAFGAIHRLTGGVPRKINLLCNLLLMHESLSPQATIDLEMVDAAARKLEGGIDPVDTGLGTAESFKDTLVPTTSEPILCIVGGLSDYIKAAALLRELAKQSDRPVKLVSTYAGDCLRHNLMLFDSIDRTLDVIDLRLPANAPNLPVLRDSLRRTLEQNRPAAVVVFDGSALAFTAAALARRHNVRVLHIGGGVRASESSVIGPDMAKRTDDLSDIVYACDADAAGQLFQEGFSEERIVLVGSLLADTSSNTPAKPNPVANSVRMELPFLSAAPFEKGYALVQLNQPANTANRETLIGLMSILRQISKELPLVWPVDSRVAQRLEALHPLGYIESDRVVYVDELPYTQFADLICNAICVITDSWNVQEEATAVGTPCITIGTVRERSITSHVGSNTFTGMNGNAAIRAVWDCLFNGGKEGKIPDLWDGEAAHRLVQHLLPWLEARRR